MPYSSVSEAESRNPGIRSLSAKQKRAWVAAFNSAKQRGADDTTAAKVAWSAAKGAAKKNEGDDEVTMDEISKVTVAVEGDVIAFGVPFTKIDIKNRTIEGFATLDNIDKADEIVDFEASREAFDSWIGNIREMHAPKAVGKAIHIEERQLEKNGKFYHGIWVKARISKGAKDTWEKILDGTLSGYSIGGRVLERRPETLKSDDERFSRRIVNRITKYLLAELSVVDNPMNPLAVFEGILKSDHAHAALIKYDSDGSLVASDIVIEDKGLFYCEVCDVAKTDDFDAVTIPCVTCDGMMVKIGQVAESPSVTKLQKMVEEYHSRPKDEIISIPESEPEPIEQTEPPQADPLLSTQKTEGPKIVIEFTEPLIDADELVSKLAVSLKSRAESLGTNNKDIERDEEVDFVESMMLPDDYKVVNAHKTPPKGYPTDKSQYGDPENFKYPLDTPGRIRAAMTYFNHSGQRTAGGYSMSKWASIGRRIASAANREFGSGHVYSNGKIVSEKFAKTDIERGEMLIELQKNDTSVNTNIVGLLKNLVGFFSKRDSVTAIEGGETQTLDPKELEKILEILDVATGEIREVLKGFNVQSLNSEDAAGPSLGSDPGEAGVGTAQENDGGTVLSSSEVETANQVSMPAPDDGPEKVAPHVPTDGTGDSALAGVTADSGPEKVLPHADLPAASDPVGKAEESEETKAEEPVTEEVIEKAEETTEEAPVKEDGVKGVLDELMKSFDEKFEKIANRIENIETSGGVKKSVEVAENTLKKSDPDEVWGGIFYSGELSN